MSEYPLQYIFKKSNSIFSYLGIIIALVGLILFSYTYFFYNSSNNLLILNVISVFSINIGIFIWEFSFFRRCRYFNVLYTPFVILLIFLIIPMWISIVSPYEFILTNAIFGDNLSLITNQSLFVILQILSIADHILIFIDMTFLAFFLLKEVNNFYFSIPFLEKFLQFYTENPSVSILSFNDFSSYLGVSAEIIHTYIDQLITYNPEIGEIDEIDENFKNSSRTVPVLKELIQSMRESPQEQFRKRYLRDGNKNIIIYQKEKLIKENDEISQVEEADQRKVFYSNLLDGPNSLVLKPNTYISKIADQYINRKINIKNSIIFFLILFMIIYIPLLIIDKKETFNDKIFVFGGVILICILLPILTFGLESLMIRIFPGLNKNPFRHLIKALETGNADIFVSEIKRMEDIKIKYHNSKLVNKAIFRYCKAYFLILINDIQQAQRMLEKLKIPIRKRFALRGEVDLLLAGLYEKQNEKIKSLKMLKEAKSIFEKNNITEPILLINEKITTIENH